jgi:hypothetical protein
MSKAEAGHVDFLIWTMLIGLKFKKLIVTIKAYRVIINDCLIAVGVGDVVECAASFIT